MKHLILFLSCILASAGFSQQLPAYSQNYITPFAINPSQAGYNSSIDVFMLHRNQWASMPGAPVTSSILIDGPIKTDVNGVGLQVYSDETGIFVNTGVKAAYAHRFNLTKDKRTHLLVGASLDMLDSKVDFTRAVVVNYNEPSLFQTAQRKSSLNGTFGLTFVWRALELGFTAPQLVSSRLKYSDNLNTAYFGESRHYISTLKYVFSLSKKRGITLYPYVVMRNFAHAPMQYDFNAVVDVQNKIWAAVGYRSDNSISFNAGVRLYNAFTIGYSYDLIRNTLASSFGRSSEIVVGISLNYLEKKKAVPMVDTDGDGVPDEFDQEANTALGALVNFQGRTIPTYPPVTIVEQKVDTTNYDRDGDRVPDSVDMELGTKHGVAVNSLGQMMIIDSVKSVYETSFFFDLDKSTIKPGHEGQFVSISRALKENPSVRIVLSGNTDVRGSAAYNLNLGQKRAQNIASVLIKDYDVPPDRISVVMSKGKSDPLSKTKHNVNRRVDVTVEKVNY